MNLNVCIYFTTFLALSSAVRKNKQTRRGVTYLNYGEEDVSEQLFGTNDYNDEYAGNSKHGNHGRYNIGNGGNQRYQVQIERFIPMSKKPHKLTAGKPVLYEGPVIITMNGLGDKSYPVHGERTIPIHEPQPYAENVPVYINHGGGYNSGSYVNSNAVMTPTPSYMICS